MTLSSNGIVLIGNGLSVMMVSLLASALPGNAQNASSPVTSTSLTPLQQNVLRATGLKIAMPNYVPAGFTLTKVQTEVDRNTRIGGLGYTLFYYKDDPASSRLTCFAIEATNGGIGDLPPGNRQFPINSPVFGKTTLEYGNYGKSGSTFLSNWLGPERGPFYRFAGAGAVPGMERCTNVTPEEAVRITESIR